MNQPSSNSHTPLYETLYECPLESGELVFCRPLSPYTRFMFLQEAHKLHPDPDPAPYQEDVPGAAVPLKQFVEGSDKHQQYQQALKAAQHDRANHLFRAVLFSGVVTDTPEGRRATIARYATQLEQIRTFGDGVPDDDWLAVVTTCLVATSNDVVRIYNTASQALSEEEIRSGVRLFQRQVQ